jgi:hypothetical protein
MVYFGVLKEEDAQCFGVTSRIGFNAFVLVAGAILLTFLSSFVSKAVVQYLRDETQSKLRHKGKDDFTITFPDETSQSNDGDGVTDAGVATNIGQVPVLFTDTFRWILKASNSITSSNRTLFLDPNNSHWSLPEATVVTTDNSSPDGRNMKGTYVHDLASAGKVDIASSGGSSLAARGSLNKMRQGSIDSASMFSFDSYQSSPRGKELNYDDDIDEMDSYRLSHRQSRLKIERRESTSSLGQQSIKSKMDSIGSSSYGENFEASSFVHGGVNTNASIESPTAKAISATRSPGSSQKAPPPPGYRLSAKSLEKSPRSHSSASNASSTHKSKRNLKKLAPVYPSSPRFTSGEEDYTHVSIKSECSRATLFTDDDNEYSTVKSINEIMKEVEDDADLHFGDSSFGQQSVSHHSII